jgi:hypothetical protein
MRLSVALIEDDIIQRNLTGTGQFLKYVNKKAKSKALNLI